MKLNILGTEYNFIETSERDDCRLNGNDGICDINNKDILIERVEEYDTNDSQSTRNINYHIDEVKRHEIIHAFFHESGINDADREWIVEWLAIQFPKILKAFQEVDCI